MVCAILAGPERRKRKPNGAVTALMMMEDQRASLISKTRAGVLITEEMGSPNMKLTIAVSVMNTHNRVVSLSTAEKGDNRKLVRATQSAE
jgi:mRNA-degrading endonuclease toxin of MazEF toxin-antitoxin module